MENLFCTRFNFLLVAYSLFVTAAATAWQNRPLFIGVAFAGAIVCLLVWLTVIRAFLKLDVLFKILYSAFPDLPINMVDKETRATRSLFRVQELIAYVIPAFTVVSLLAGGFLMLLRPELIGGSAPVSSRANASPGATFIGRPPTR
jgi:hypothetical protein